MIPFLFLGFSTIEERRDTKKRKEITSAMKLCMFLALLVPAAVAGFLHQPTLTKTSRLPSPPNMVAARDDDDDDAKVILITGASQGLGQAMAYELAKHGQKIVVNYFPGQDESAEATVEEIKALGGDGIALPADTTNKEQVHDMMDRAFEEYGHVDVVVNNAGITRDNLVARMKPTDFQAVVHVNLFGVFDVSQAYIQRAIRKKQRGGRIINIASVVGQIGNPGQANYAASKGGVIGLTKSLAKELAPKNIKVNAVCPGFIATPMTDKLTPEQLEKSLEWIPLHRLGKPEEVAAMVRFLAIDEGADYITGHCFDVDGGVGIAAA